MTELEFENKLIEQLSTGIVINTDNTNQIGDTTDAYGNMKVYKSKLWKYEPTIKTTEALWDNFRKILYQLNQNQLTQPLSDTEFKQVQKVINELYTPYQAGQFLYGINGVSQVEVDLDDGRHVFLTVFDQKQIGAGNTVYQVVSQVKREPQIAGRPERRFDTTLLINGLPIIQIEEKSVKHSVDEALNQMHQYIQEKQYSDIFSTVQILVAMTPNRIKYMANTTADLFNKDFAFEWQNPNDNKVVRNWTTFADMFLSIPMAHQMSTLFTILDGTKNKQMLKVMRPYQVYATKAVLNELKRADFDLPINKLGYVWHTTGSGKTITSFKTAWLASRMPNVDKVVFVVDRIALTKQTEANYKAYDPEGSIDIDGKQFDTVGGTENTSALKKKLNEKGYGIIVTSVQKLNTLINRKDFVVPNKNFVFIVDEAHRSTGGESFEDLQKVFKGAAWVGYTGTPMFDKVVGKKGTKTHEVFGKLLHAYTIREAIADKNVLGFKVDFETTIAEDKMKLEYLPKFYKEKYPDWNDLDIERKIANLTDNDMDDMIEPSFYDNNQEHVKLVVEDIFKNWRNRSNDGAYNAMLTTHVGGNRPSTPMALSYFEEFERVNQERQEQGLPTLKVGITFSMSTNNSDNQLTTNNGLLHAIKHYNKMFGTSFGLDDVSGYTQDLTTRLNRTAQDGQYLDIVIVVDQLLTGFDAPTLNTLFVDKNLRYHGLIQAFSRTNRIYDATKSFGNIVTFRDLEKATTDAIKLFGKTETAEVLLERSYQEYMTGFTEAGEEQKGYMDVVQELQEKFPDPQAIIKESDKKEFVSLFGQFLRLDNILQNYDDFMSLRALQELDILDDKAVEAFKERFHVDDETLEELSRLDIPSTREIQDYRSTYNDIKSWYENERRNYEDSESKVDWDSIVFEVELLKSQEINLDYILELIFETNKKVSDKDELVSEITRTIRASLGNRAKEDLIVAFIHDSDLDSFADKSDIIEQFFIFAQGEQKREADELIQTEGLNEQSAKRYIQASLKHEYASENGNDLNEALPKMSPLNPQYRTKKQTVFQKISSFVEKFKGIGGDI